MNSATRFLMGLGGVTSAVFAVTLALGKAEVITLPSFQNATLMVCAFSTAFIFFFLDRAHPQQPLDFVRNFFLTVVAKLIGSGVYVFLILRLDPAGANTNVIFFILNYFLFTAYEITWFAWKKNAE
ncbi:MAG: hypothetical protein ACOVMQ_08355 [Cyclobacteriaceae bacterium]|jgi:hypothetical protein